MKFALLVAPTLAAQAFAAPPVITSPLRPADSGGPVVALTLDAGAYAALKAAGAATLSDFPLPGGIAVTLEVAPLDVFADGAQLVLGTAGGDAALERPDLLILSGSVADEPGSRVFLSLSPEAVHGYIIRAQSTCILSSGPHNQGLPPVIYDTATVPPELITLADSPCGTDALPLPPGAVLRSVPAGSGGPTGRTAPCREIKIAVETDWEYSGNVFGGNTGAASAYAATLVGAVSEIYKSEFNASFKIGYLRVWASNTDPYSAGDIGGRLTEFRNYWNSVMFTVPRNVAHILSGAGGGGVAYLPGLCQSGYGYGASGNLGGYFPYPLDDWNAQNWDLMVVAHELGHNFGAPHTHSTSPPIDGCGNGDCSLRRQGTIMSYCHTCSGGMRNIALTMHTRIINENILPYLGSLVCNIVFTPVSITDQPDSQTVTSGASVNLSVTATGSATLSYQWYKAGAPIAGATSNQFAISPAHPEDSGSYSVRVSNQCGTVESDPAVVTVNYCPSDYNQDGFVDGIDSDAFNNDFEAGNPAADYNGDGFVDGIDYDRFNNDFESGC